MTPTDVMDRPAWKFWMDARIRAAGKAWENEQQRATQSSTDAGVATDGEKEDLVRANENRADQREQADSMTPDMAEQMDALRGTQ